MNIKDYFGVNVEFEDKDDLICKVQSLVVAENLSGGEKDTLLAAWRSGLMESGDTPSKGARSELIDKGLLCQTAWEKNNYTFSVTYPLGYQVVQALQVNLFK